MKTKFCGGPSLLSAPGGEESKTVKTGGLGKVTRYGGEFGKGKKMASIFMNLTTCK